MIPRVRDHFLLRASSFSITPSKVCRYNCVGGTFVGQFSSENSMHLVLAAFNFQRNHLSAAQNNFRVMNQAVRESCVTPRPAIDHPRPLIDHVPMIPRLSLLARHDRHIGAVDSRRDATGALPPPPESPRFISRTAADPDLFFTGQIRSISGVICKSCSLVRGSSIRNATVPADHSWRHTLIKKQ
jgi:hypothetical protein